MGKRQIGELEISDFITTLLISEIASLPITDTNIPLSHAIIPITVLLTLEVVSSALLVKFPDGEYIGGENPIDTYKETILKIGIDELKRRRIELGGKPLIATTDITKAYTEIEPGVWLAIPTTTKEKVKYIKIIGSFMRIPLEVTIID
jgi:hypothetical protein